VDIEARLTEIEARLAIGHREEPEMMLRRLIEQMGRQSLTDWRPTLDPVIELFQPRRRKRLLEFLDARISGRATQVAEPASTTVYPEAHRPSSMLTPGRRSSVATSASSVKGTLQWATSYRDCLFRHFDRFLAPSEAATRDRASRGTTACWRSVYAPPGRRPPAA